MSQLELNKWQDLLPGMTIPDDVKFINIDTRDFHCYYATELPTGFTNNTPGDVTWSKVSASNVYLLISDLRKAWQEHNRHMLILKEPYGHWLKYIWLRREDDGQFSVWNRNFSKPLNIVVGLADLINWEMK